MPVFYLCLSVQEVAARTDAASQPQKLVPEMPLLFNILTQTLHVII
jgi:hypothetical protein